MVISGVAALRTKINDTLSSQKSLKYKMYVNIYYSDNKCTVACTIITNMSLVC